MKNTAPPPEMSGNPEIFNLQKTAFLCSRKIPAAAVLKIYDWAGQMREQNACVMSGFHTTMECDVWKILLAGNSPLVWVCARGVPKKTSITCRRALDGGQLLIVSPFAEKNRPTKKTAHLRNLFILQRAEKTVIGHAAPNGKLSAALAEMPPKNPPLYLSAAEK